MRAIWRLANAYLASEAPWKIFDADPARAALVVRIGINLVAVAASVARPFIPATAARVSAALGSPAGAPDWPDAELAAVEAGRNIGDLPPLFAKLSPEWAEANAARFDGNGTASSGR